MKYSKIILMALTLIGVSACQTTVRSPEVKMKTADGLELEVKDGSSSKDSGFCPPGQAKKGNC